jgi:hypothetical protein
MPTGPAGTATARRRAKSHGELRREDAGTREVAASLQRYADRGVFRGLSVSEGRNGRREFRFRWLTRMPMLLSYAPRSSTLAFPRLIPGAAARPSMVAALKGVVAEHLGSTVPEHRRVDKRRATVTCAVRDGHISLSLAVRGTHHAYAVKAGLNLVNRLFLELQAHHPEYLIQQFGFSEE